MPASSRIAPPTRVCRLAALVATAAMLLGSCATRPPTAARPVADFASPSIEPEMLKDPAEPINRGIFAFNRVLLEAVVDPAAQVYQALVPRRVRTSVNHFTHNAMFPGRFVNETLQGRWQDLGEDSLRFLTNTTVGVAGLFDVASRWKIAKPRADFGQTFQVWGWKPTTYVMLPVLGPSDETNAAGTAVEELTEVWNYDQLARRISFATTFNRITESSGELVRLIRSEADPYNTTKLAWTYLSKNAPPDWTLRGPRDMPTLETLAIAAIQLDDPEFPRKGLQLNARTPATGRKLPFNCWIQPKPAPLVFISPGLGSHRLSTTTLTVAEFLYAQGFSVVTTSSAFHPEFMEQASTADLPAHLPTDSADLLAALTSIHSLLEKKYPRRFTHKALVGLSMGGFQALYIAAHESQQPAGTIRFDRLIAINPPVDLHYGITRIDAFHDAPLAWPADERQSRVNNTVHKVGGLTRLAPNAMAAPPFEEIESKYLIGLTFRYTLRDVLFNLQSREKLGMLGSKPPFWSRASTYQNITDYSYHDYVNRLVFPHFRSQGVDKTRFKKFSTLPAFLSSPTQLAKTRVLSNANDFLLTGAHLAWLKRTFGPRQIHVFPRGGHLGNLASPELRSTLLDFLKDLR